MTEAALTGGSGRAGSSGISGNGDGLSAEALVTLRAVVAGVDAAELGQVWPAGGGGQVGVVHVPCKRKIGSGRGGTLLTMGFGV